MNDYLRPISNSDLTKLIALARVNRNGLDKAFIDDFLDGERARTIGMAFIDPDSASDEALNAKEIFELW